MQEPPAADIRVARAAQRSPDRKPASGIGAGLFGLSVLALLAYGFLHRDDNWYTPEHGLGYMFGIVGSILVLILLLYPLRKRFKSWRSWGRLPNWLKFHMFLGVSGPTLILFHANFKLGATNSNVALLTMVTVMLSGIVGRYIYGKTHHRYSGELRTLQEMRAQAQQARGDLQFDFMKIHRVQTMLDGLERRVLDPDHGLLSSSWLHLDFSLSMGDYRRKLLKHAFASIDENARFHGLDRRQNRAQKKAASEYLTTYLRSLQSAAQFKFYERMFALWHVLHVPLLFVLIAAAVVHIVAVHLY
ncbi:MAG: hypothetical protein ABL973_09680 [Micropepsaceae bacterium]